TLGFADALEFCPCPAIVERLCRQNFSLSLCRGAAELEKSAGERERSCSQVLWCLLGALQHGKDIVGFERRADAAPDRLFAIADVDRNMHAESFCDAGETCCKLPGRLGAAYLGRGTDGEVEDDVGVAG